MKVKPFMKVKAVQVPKILNLAIDKIIEAQPGTESGTYSSPSKARITRVKVNKKKDGVKQSPIAIEENQSQNASPNNPFKNPMEIQI